MRRSLLGHDSGHGDSFGILGFLIGFSVGVCVCAFVSILDLPETMRHACPT